MKTNTLHVILLLSCLGHSMAAIADKPLYSLTDNKGRAVATSTYAGSTQFVFFGFAHCPDVCPSALVNMKLAYSSLDEDAKNDVQPVFITVDPVRDTVHAVDRYVENLEGFVGLTGSEADIKKTLNTFKVFAVTQIGQQKDDYDVNHTSLIYVVNKNGVACESFSSDISTADLSIKMREYSANDTLCKATS